MVVSLHCRLVGCVLVGLGLAGLWCLGLLLLATLLVLLLPDCWLWCYCVFGLLWFCAITLWVFGSLSLCIV